MPIKLFTNKGARTKYQLLHGAALPNIRLRGGRQNHFGSIADHHFSADVKGAVIESASARSRGHDHQNCDRGVATCLHLLMKTPDRSETAFRQMVARLIQPVARVLGCLALFVPGAMLSAATVEYDLTLNRQAMNFTGHPVEAMTINGQLPGPTLRFTEGDHAVIRVHNQMNVETSIHWHGILLPNAMDGVPFLTFPPIAPGKTFTYQFDLRQSGTYWYHSHTMLQEQRGLFGALVVTPKIVGEFDRLRDHVVVLSDWTDEDASSVLHTLKRGSEWYSVRKGSGQSVLGAARLGMLGAYLSRELQRMPPMDLADIYYDRFLLNGAPEQTLAAQPGEKIRLRVIDGSASTFFFMQFAGGPLQVIGADGQLVQPFDAPRLLMGVAETYDVVVTVPAEGSYEFRATSHDGSGQTSLWIGSGPRHAAPDIPFPNLYVNMGALSLKRVLALTPGGSMGMPDDAVRAGKFDQPGMNAMGGMKDMDGMKTMDGMKGMGGMTAMDGLTGMDHGEMKPETGNAKHAPMTSAPAEEHKGHDMSGRAHEKMPMDMGMNAPVKHAAAKSNWLGLLAADVSAKSPLAADGMSPERPGPPYDKLRALQSTAFDASKPVHQIRLTLDGDMERYVWFLNNKPLSASDDIEIKRGEVVRFVMINRTMMHHPMHLHGHFFRVLNAQGEFSPLKHTVDVAPMTTTVIEFSADAFGDWFFHCHLLYHMTSGMARVVHYQDFAPDPATAAVRPQLYHDPFYFWGDADVLTNMTQGYVEFSNTQNIFNLEWEAGWHNVPDPELETTFLYERYFNRFFRLVGGVDSSGTLGSGLGSYHSADNRGVFGLMYKLPLNIDSTVWADTNGGARGRLSKNILLAPRLMLGGEVRYDTHNDWEGRVHLDYMVNKNASIIGQWHSTYGWGIGLRVRF
jgi:FtsP/CotA-like multicopper oxidase with cupredoxin domain